MHGALAISEVRVAGPDSRASVSPTVRDPRAYRPDPRLSDTLAIVGSASALNVA
jgi:hypothetical protein